MKEINSESSPDGTKLPVILCVDDEPNILSSLRRLFRDKGYQVRTATSGKEGLALLATETVDLVISDMRMPEMDGTHFLEQVRLRWPDTIRLLLTGYSDINSTIGAINRGEIYRYTTKPWDDNDIVLIVRQAIERKTLGQEKKRLETLIIRQNEELKNLNASLEAKVEARTIELRIANDSLLDANEKLKTSFITSIKVFSALIEMRGGSLAGNSRRVADLSRRIALKLKLESRQVQDVFVAGLLHEIGKVGFADDLINTPVALMTTRQIETYRKHTVRAEQLLMPLPDLRNAAEIIGGQLERFDGTGFPARLLEQNIPIGARILALASDYEKLQIGTLSQRKLSEEEARTVIIQSSGKRYDPEIVITFADMFKGISREEAERESSGEIHVKSRDLQVGMVLSRDLISPNGLLMLAVDHTLDERLIRKIKDFEKSSGIQLSAHIRLDRRT